MSLFDGAARGATVPRYRPADVELTVPIPVARPAERLREGPATDRRRAAHRVPRRRVSRSTLWRAATTAGTFTALLVVVAAVLVGYTYQKYNKQITRVAVLSTKDPNIRDAARQQTAANFLVIGSDTRAGADAKFGNVAGARSDTTILVHLSPDRTKATVISIPRDSWVAIPACTAADGSLLAEHSGMFNSAFSEGGPACTIKTVQRLTGIAVTHFVEIDFSGFQAMVNAMGAVNICSPQPVFDPGSGLRLHVGTNSLNGAQALAYVRARETLGDGSDLGRIRRQQVFLGAVLRQAMHGSMLSDPVRLTSFLDAATKAIIVDKATTFDDLRTLATSMQGLDPAHVSFFTAPIANADYTPPGTTQTGRVLLDGAQGRVLYDSVIEDRRPALGHGTASPAAPRRPAGAAAAAAPKASLNAAQLTCSL